MPGGAPMAPPGGGPPPAPGGAINPELEKSLKTWMILSILTFFCGCWCLAAVPAYLAYAGQKSLSTGNVADAESKLKIAKICTILGFVWGILSTIGGILYYVLVVMASAAS
jgi:cytochrome c biogenesis protein CcdA